MIIEIEFKNDMIGLIIYEDAFHRFCGKIMYIMQDNNDIASLSIV